MNPAWRSSRRSIPSCGTGGCSGSCRSFDYVWEVYVPEQKRRWGYYVLPVLFGDRLVGRIEPRLDRATKTLRILGIWWEDGFSPRTRRGSCPRCAMLSRVHAIRRARLESSGCHRRPGQADCSAH